MCRCARAQLEGRIPLGTLWVEAAGLCLYRGDTGRQAASGGAFRPGDKAFPCAGRQGRVGHAPGAQRLRRCVPGPLGGENRAGAAARAAGAGFSTSQPPSWGEASGFAAVSLPRGAEKGTCAVLLCFSQPAMPQARCQWAAQVFCLSPLSCTVWPGLPGSCFSALSCLCSSCAVG